MVAMSDVVRSMDGGLLKGGTRSAKSSARCRACTPEAVAKQVVQSKIPSYYQLLLSN